MHQRMISSRVPVGVWDSTIPWRQLAEPATHGPQGDVGRVGPGGDATLSPQDREINFVDTLSLTPGSVVCTAAGDVRDWRSIREGKIAGPGPSSTSTGVAQRASNSVDGHDDTGCFAFTLNGLVPSNPIGRAASETISNFHAHAHGTVRLSVPVLSPVSHARNYCVTDSSSGCIG